jgi:hypothetical protein
VAALQLGRRLLGLSIRQAGHVGGYSLYAQDETLPVRLNGGIPLSGPAQEAFICLAGPGAEEHWLGYPAQWAGAERDLAQARALVAPPELAALLEEVHALWRTPERWALVEAIASALLERHALSRDEVLDIIVAAGKERTSVETPSP